MSKAFSGILSSSEIEAVERTIKPAIKGRELVAACIYGSRVAGYANKESDYDVILVLKNYKALVRYRYLKGDVDVAALQVDEKALMDDAKKARLGEFVVGRLLNVYLPLEGKNLLEDIEKIYKKRVVLETFNDIVSTYRELSTLLFIPTAYFLYEKLKKRATIYPPALYSYIKTYSGALGQHNLDVSLKSFREVLHLLESEELVKIKEDRIQIVYKPPKQLTRFSSVVTSTTRGIAQYAVHGYAGRVGLNVIGREVF